MPSLRSRSRLARGHVRTLRYRAVDESLGRHATHRCSASGTAATGLVALDRSGYHNTHQKHCSKGLPVVRKSVPLLTLVLIFLIAGPLLSHDFWLIPHASRVAPGSDLVIDGQTSSEFPTSVSAVTPDRVARARVITSRGERHIEQLQVVGNSLRLSDRPTQVGQALVEITIHPRTIPESPESFRRYLELEGAPEALERYEREGLLPTDSITRRYAKYAKTVVEVGEDGPRAFNTVVGHPLEFVPLTDPASAARDELLRFQLLFLGSPLATARGHASVAASAASDGAYAETTFETDANGEFAIEVTGSGLWNVRALHIVPAPAHSGADWDVHWATLVWWTAR